MGRVEEMKMHIVLGRYSSNCELTSPISRKGEKIELN